MSCSCVYVGDDHEVCSLHNAKMVKARKPHKCYECDRGINAGERYEYLSAVWDGKFFIVKTCPDCLSIRNEFFCDGWVYGEMKSLLWEHLCEMDGNINTECLESLTVVARDMVIEMIDEIIEESVDE